MSLLHALAFLLGNTHEPFFFVYAMADIVMAYTVMAYIVMVCVVMAYIVMA